MKLLLFLTFFIILLGFTSEALALSAYAWYDPDKEDIMDNFVTLLKEAGFSVNKTTIPPTVEILTQYQVLVLIFNYYNVLIGRYSFDYKRDVLLSYVSSGGNFIGIGDGGFLAAANISNVSFSSKLYATSYDVRIIDNTSVFSNYLKDEIINIGYAASYNIAFNSSIVGAPLLELLASGWEGRILSFISSIGNGNVLSFSFGCGGGTDTINCNNLHRSAIRWFKEIIAPKLVLLISSPSQALANSTIPIYSEVYYNNTPLNNLTQSNFQIFLDTQQLSIYNFQNFANGSYQFNITLPSNLLGQRLLKLKVSYENKTSENSTSIFISNSTPMKEKILFITNTSWRNILSLAPLKKPVLVSAKIDSSILNFVKNYQPEQIFLVGNIRRDIPNFKVYRISSYADIPKLFFNTSKGVYAFGKTNSTVAALLASLLNKPLVFNSTEAEQGYNFENLTREKIEEVYLEKIKEKDKNINYLILTNHHFAPFASIIASQRNGFIITTDSENPTYIRSKINEVVKKLNKKGFFINNTEYLLEGAYLLILGDIPHVIKQDPVELAWGLSDPLDGTNFTTDLEYADLNNDTYIDIAVGRLPSNHKIASLMFARTFLPDNKKALVASEYLHTNWLTILLYGGGGMWQGRTISKILEDQNYDVTRLVERRSKDPREFLQQFTPENVTSFLSQAKSIGEFVGKLLGKTIGAIVTKVLIVLKGMQYAEQALEMYLEYDWSTFGPKYERVLELIQNLDPSNLISFQTAVEVVNLLWPYPWKELNKTNLALELKNKSILYYEGIGNSSLWILPNPISMAGFMGWKQFLENRYNGSEVFLPENISTNNLRLVWDNSDLAAIGEMKEEFLEKGSASFIGASAINYAPFSAEIDSRFFKQGLTIGLALIDAINDFRDCWLVWDPLNILRPGIKAKTLREFILYGDPSLQKDPIVEEQNYSVKTICNAICELNLSIPVNYSLIQVENETSIVVETEEYFLNLSSPIIPLKTFEFFLPFQADITYNKTETSTKTFYNISIPKLDLLSHSLTNLTYATNFTTLYPEQTYRLAINKTIDNRTRIKFVHTALQYNESNKTAIVFERINLTLRYYSPLEFSVETKDIELGEVAIINLTIWSNFTDNATIYSLIQNQTHAEKIVKNITVLKGLNIFNLTYLPSTTGKYLVKVFLVKHPTTVGPRESIFTVKPKVLVSEPEEKIPGGVELTIPVGRIRVDNASEAPYKKLLERLNISENITKPIEKPLAVCGNNICEEGENYINCCLDCGCLEGMICNVSTNTCYVPEASAQPLTITGMIFAALANPASAAVILALIALILTIAKFKTVG